MNQARTIKIIEVSADQEDKNGRKYRKITVETSDIVRVTDEATQKVVETVGNARTAVIMTYEESYLNDKPDKLWNLEVGTILLGDIVTMGVESYSIEDRLVNKYTTIVLGNSSDEMTWLTQIFSTFRSNGHRCLGDTVPENVDPATGEILETEKRLKLEDEPEPSKKEDSAVASAAGAKKADEKTF